MVFGRRGPYTATPPTNAAQALQELAHLESTGPPSDVIFAAERVELRRLAGGSKQ